MTKRISTLFLAVGAGLIGLTGAHSVYGELRATPEEIIERSSPAVVRIAAYKELPVRTMAIEERDGQLYIREEVNTVNVAASSGSGFFVSSDGYILTNRHVVDDDAQYAVYTGEEEVPATVVYRDPSHDLAVLKVEGEGFSTLALSGSGTEAGSPVIAMGNALGRFVDSATAGVVTSLQEEIAVGGEIERVGRYLVLSYNELSGLIESTAKVYPGDSGGPLLNDQGDVVGINVATAVGVRVGYAIPAAVALGTLERAGVSL